MRARHLVATLPLLVATVAVAQLPQAAPSPEPVVPLGSRIPRWDTPPLAGEREAARIMRSFANCIVRSQRMQAEALLRTIPNSAEQQRILAALVGRPTSCLFARRMSISRALFRGALAEAFLALGGRMAPIPSSGPAEQFDAFSARMAAADSDGLDADDRAALVGRWLAQCVVAEHPAQVQAVLMSSYGSRGEQQALQAAQSAFSSCLLQGQALAVDRLTMRGLLAEALYHRRLRAARSAGWATPNATASVHRALHLLGGLG